MTVSPPLGNRVTPATQFRLGICFGMFAYIWWGLIPLYFRQVNTVPAGQILAHRIVWSFPLILSVVFLTKNGSQTLWSVLKTRRLLLLLLTSATLLALNWLLYIFATVKGRVAEASLGYYMLPLVNAFLATVFLGERLRPAHYPALGLIVIGVSIPLVSLGDFPWLALALPVTFGLYGLVRKKISVDSATGLTVETMIMMIPSAAYLIWAETEHQSAFGLTRIQDFWLIFSGIATVVPLLLYTLSIRMIPLITQAFIQFVSPTVQFLLATWGFGEMLSSERWAAIICVWVAVSIFIFDAIILTKSRRDLAKADRQSE